MILWIATTAWAGDVVLFDGMEAAEAVLQVQADGGATVTAAGLSTLLLGRPITAWPGAAEGCAGDATGSIDEAIRRARAKLDYLDADGAIAEVEAALRGLPCLPTAANAGAVARLFFLEGVAQAAAGRADEATAAFARARVFVPDLAWDAAYPPDALPLFEAAAPSEARFRLSVYPPRGDAVVVDGRGGRVSGDAIAGPHLVQALGDAPIGAWVSVEADTLVLLPSLVTDRDVRGVTDPELAAPLARAIAAALPEPTDVYVALPRGTWRITSGDAAWSRVATHHPARRRVVAPLALAGGSALTLGGAALYGVSYAQGSRAWRDGDASTGATHAEYEAALPTYEAAKQRMGLGGALAGAGAVIAGVGVVIELGGPR